MEVWRGGALDLEADEGLVVRARRMADDHGLKVGVLQIEDEEEGWGGEAAAPPLKNSNGQKEVGRLRGGVEGE